MARVERALGVTKDYFSYHRRTNRIDHGALLATLRELDVDPADFFTELYGRPAEDDDPGTGKPAGASEPGDGGENLGPVLDGSELSFGPEDPELAAALEPWIAEMDETRYDDCEEALAELRGRAGEIPVDAGAGWLAVAASCLRMAGDLEDASRCLRAARAIAPRQGVFANVLQRQSYVLRDRGEFGEALRLSERAGGIFARLGDREALGKTLIDQGQFLYLLGRWRAAGRSIREAMVLVPRTARRSWQAIHQYLAICLQKEGSLAESQAHAREAESLAADRQQRAGVLWLRAEIDLEMGRYQEAADAYASTLDLIPSQAFERLVTTAHLVRARALQGAPDEAARVARSAVEYMGAFSGNRLAQALILEMYKLTARDCRQAAKLDGLIRAARKLRPAAGGTGTLGDRLVRARRRQNLSRRQAAGILGIAETSLLNIERGRMPGRSFEERITAWLMSVSPESRLAASVLG